MLRKTYGIEPGDKVQEALARRQERAGKRLKLKWVVKDCNKFEALVADMGVFFQKLYDVANLGNAGQEGMEHELGGLGCYLKGMLNYVY